MAQLFIEIWHKVVKNPELWRGEERK